MKLQGIAAFAVGVITTVVSAKECTDTEFAAFVEYDQAPLKKACPSLFLEEEGTADPTHLETFTDETLKTLEPCKAKECLAELKTFVDATADCTVNGLAIKSVATATYKLCDVFNTGPVSVEAAKNVFKDVSADLNEAFGSLLDDDESSEAGSSSAGTTIAKDDNPSNATGKGSSATVPAPTPTPTSKSSASGLHMATGIAISMIIMIVVSVGL